MSVAENPINHSGLKALLSVGRGSNMSLDNPIKLYETLIRILGWGRC